MRFENYLDESINLGGLKNVWDKIRKELKNMSFSEIEKRGAEAFYKISNDRDIIKDEKGWDILWQSYIEFPTDDNEMLQRLFKKHDKAMEKYADTRSTRNKEAMSKYFGMTSESIQLNEDVKHWWDLVKTEAFPTLAFYPALQVWLELDKLVKGSGYNQKVMLFYAALWLTLISGKYVAGWMKWKKENKSEYEAEKAQGKGGIV